MAEQLLGNDGVDVLLQALAEDGYRVIGPRIRDGAIVYDDVASVEDLPVGWTDEQEAGTYRLKRRDDAALFGYNVGPHSWKQFLFPARRRLWSAHKRDEGEGDGSFFVETPEEGPFHYAFIGVRACELQAIAVQDRVLLEGSYQDPGYRRRREDNFIVAVSCTQAGATCFCTSMGTGPRVASGYDLSLTEVVDAQRHYFVAEAGTERGAALLARLPARRAAPGESQEAERRIEEAARSMGREMDTTNIKALLYGSYEHPRWSEVASRCLSCTNCTLVCPTCFCSTVGDTTDLTGRHTERWQRWDSCFTLDHSYVHGSSVRASTQSRYRQWLTHKLGTWIDQFGMSGCVGCGRCIAWCPVGIDITEEVAVLRDQGREQSAHEGEGA